MKIRATKGSGFEKQEVGEDLVLTNIFGTMEQSDFVEWDLTDPSKPILSQKMTHKPGNNSFARGCPMFVRGTAHGKLYDSYGYQSGKIKADPKLGTRGTIWEKAPAADLYEVQKLVQYPCSIVEMPETVVSVSADIPTHMNNNLIIDMYAHLQNGVTSDDMNDHIQPPFSKHLNCQLQLDHGAINIHGAHAWGWSGVGSNVLGEITIDGQRWRYGYKFETLNGNRFPFISFCGWNGSKYVPVKEVKTDSIWKWIVENWDVIAFQAKTIGLSYGNVTQESLERSFCDGVHVGSEILGASQGSIRFSKMNIEVGELSSPMSALKVSEVCEVCEACGQKTLAVNKKEAKTKVDTPSQDGTKENPFVLPVDKEKKFLKEEVVDRVRAYKHGDIVSNLGVWKGIKLRGLKVGLEKVTYTSNGSDKDFWVRVI